MERIRIKMLVALLFLCLSATAQTEYSGIAGASPRLVRAAKQAANKQANHSTKPSTTATASKPKTANEGKVNSKNDNYAPQSNNNEGGETEVKEGFKTLSRGVSKVFKREAKSVGEVTRRIGNGGKKFFKKLGKDISDSFKPDSTSTK